MAEDLKICPYCHWPMSATRREHCSSAACAKAHREAGQTPRRQTPRRQTPRRQTPRRRGPAQWTRGGRPLARTNSSFAAERRFHARVGELGGLVVEPKWLGSATPHRVICAKGHVSSPRPRNVLNGRGICAACTGKGPEGAERRFRERLAEIGATLVEPEWLGRGEPHRVICADGHECAPRPGNVLMGRGICPTCGMGSTIAHLRSSPRVLDAEQRFRARVEELGAMVVEPRWLGTMTPHRVICAVGHECAPWPSNVLAGSGVCGLCTRAASNAFYVVEDEPVGAIKLGITSGDGGGRLGVHRRAGFTTVLRFLPDLHDAALLEAHTLRTLEAAGVKPVRGKEYFERSALAVVLDIVDHWPR